MIVGRFWPGLGSGSLNPGAAGPDPLEVSSFPAVEIDSWYRMMTYKKEHGTSKERSGREVIKLFTCSTQLSIKSELVINRSLN